MAGEDVIGHWAHVLWQCNGLRMEDFLNMEKETQLAYIASHQLETKKPINLYHRFIKSFFRRDK